MHKRDVHMCVECIRVTGDGRVATVGADAKKI